jgi:fructose-bisphosphate aldolase class II
MPLITNKEIMTNARKGGYAVGAFNVNNMEIVQAIVSAAVEEKSPAIIAVTEGAIKYAGLEYLVNIVKTASNLNPQIPLTLHLDHGQDLKTIEKCINGGFTSVMIDGSHLPLAENIAITKKVVEMAHPKGVSVEGELGRLKGIEDNISVDEKDAILTHPDEAKKFVDESGVDALAVAIGTSHGAYKFKGSANLDFVRLKEIIQKTNVLLVLHGASGVPANITEKAVKYGAKFSGAKGVPDDNIQQAVKLGITKINIDTDTRLSLTAGIREVLAVKPDEFDPRKILGPARDLMKETAKLKMRLFGSNGKA